MQVPAAEEIKPLECQSVEQFCGGALLLQVEHVTFATAHVELQPLPGQDDVFDAVLQRWSKSAGVQAGSDAARVALMRLKEGIKSYPLTQEAFCARLPDGTALVVARAESVARAGEEAILRQAHAAQIQRALECQLPVNADAAREYGLSAVADRQRNASVVA